MKALIIVYSAIMLIDTGMDARLGMVPFWLLTLAYLGAIVDLYFFRAAYRFLRGVTR
jgi:hypothetical protein